MDNFLPQNSTYLHHFPSGISDIPHHPDNNHKLFGYKLALYIISDNSLPSPYTSFFALLFTCFVCSALLTWLIHSLATVSFGTFHAWINHLFAPFMKSPNALFFQGASFMSSGLYGSGNGIHALTK